MSRKKKIAVGLVVTLAVFLLFVFFLLPPIVKSQSCKAITAATGRSCRMSDFSLNPFTLTATLRDFVIDESGPKPGQKPLFSVGLIRASLSPSSLFRGAVIVNELTIDRPSASISRYAANRYSFSDILDRQKKQPPSKEKGKLSFSVNNITLRNGSLDFYDAVVDGGRRHTITGLDVGIPFVSNMPYLADKYIAPRIRATVNGTPFAFDGKLKPFTKAMETSLHVGIKRLNLPTYLSYAPVPPPVRVPSGDLSVDADIAYRISAQKKPELAVSGTVRLDDASIRLSDGRPLLKAPALVVKATRIDPFANRCDLESISAEGVELYASRDRKGVWMFDRLLPREREKAEKEERKEKEAPKQPLRLQIASVAFKNGAFHFTDGVPEKGNKVTVSKIDASVTNFGTETHTPAPYKLSMLANGECGIESSGSFVYAPMSLAGTASIKDLDFRHVWPYLSPYLVKPVQGRLDVSTALAYSAEKGLAVHNGKATLRGLGIRYGNNEGIDLARLAITDVSYRQKENRLEIGDIGLSKGKASVSREADGKMSILSVVKQKGGGQAPPARSQSPAAASKKAPHKRGGGKGSPEFSYRVKKLHLDGIDFAFTDKVKEEHPRFTLNNTSLTLGNINGPKLTAMPLRFASRFQKSAPIAASGTINPAPVGYSGTISLGKVPIREFEDYFPDDWNVMVVAGYLDTDLKVDIAVKDGKPTGSFKGLAGVRSFHLLDAAEEEDLLKWESLQFDDIQGTLEPFSLGIHEVSLSNVYSRVVVREDGTLNLQNLKEKPAAPTAPVVVTAATAKSPTGASATVATVTTAAPPAAPASEVKPINIGTVVVQGGTLAFSDRHLSKPFNSTFYNLGGRVSGLTSESAKFADVDLRGNLDNRSPLQITGRINPLRGDLFVDLKISFRDIELPPATPYSGTYLGYAIDQGKLFLDLKYLIDKKQLTSENKVFIDQFTFGDKVDSKQATALPVRLAVGLLKDRNGEIHLDLPVTGRTDDPKFSVWGVVWQMVKNLFVKAATSPFTLLSSMFGKEQDLSSVVFEPGSSRLSATETEKLKTLAKALGDRPGVRLEVTGFVSREKDPEGYRRELLKKKMKNEKFLQTVKKQKEAAGLSPDTMEVTPEEYPDILKAVYEKEKFPKPRTAFGTLKSLPDDEMIKLILTNIIVGDHQLGELAHERCATVISYLAGDGKLPQERIFEKSGDIYAAPKEGPVRGRVEFGIGVK